MFPAGRGLNYMKLIYKKNDAFYLFAAGLREKPIKLHHGPHHASASRQTDRFEIA